MQSITILGATGSIGVSTLEVLALHPDRYRVHALTGRTRIKELADQCRRFRPARAVVAEAAAVDTLRLLLGDQCGGMQIDFGADAL